MLVRNSLIKDSRGAVGIVFGLIAFVVFVAAGAGLDFGRAFSTRMALQAATDAAATAAAAAPSNSDAISLATNVFQANYTGSPAPQLSVAVTGERATVTAATTIKTTLMGVSGIDELAVSASSEAETYAIPVCILLLETTQTGLDVDSNSILDASDCGIHVNSDNGSQALSVRSNGQVMAAHVCVVGGTDLQSGGTVSPTPTPGCKEKPDPMLGMPEPFGASAPCDHTNFVVPDGYSMLPGVYCGKTEISGNAAMAPGIYVVSGGEFLVKSGATVTGSEIMLFFKDRDARLDVKGGSTFKITAPKSGTYEGVLMFQSRHPDTLNALPHVIEGNAATRLEGSIYAPNGILEVGGNAVANVLADYTVIVARRMVLNSNGTLQVRSNYSGNTPRPPMLARFNTNPSARLVR
jgi:hypothetical protein